MTTDSMIPVKYIYPLRETFEFRARRYFVLFKLGETKLAPKALADVLLRHVDMFEVGKSAKGLDVIQEVEATKPRLPDTQEARDLIERMEREELCQFAKDKFNQSFPRTMPNYQLKDELTRLIDIYGVA